ncbi:hypothetical protein HS088_TW11G00299 [Tripterygium wilfordii]|uniref:Uncharacterized protein n=1 Tax=Tripterygium wilfordii TaxID=458696 RepID=A0A7J7D1N4_TRIWF|nr:hypothetical protein HS088_TW11G00299 [Tripterygium wilfordii]
MGFQQILLYNTTTLIGLQGRLGSSTPQAFLVPVIACKSTNTAKDRNEAIDPQHAIVEHQGCDQWLPSPCRSGEG